VARQWNGRLGKQVSAHTQSVEEVSRAQAGKLRKAVKSQRVVLRDGDNGQVQAEVIVCREWEWSAKEQEPQELWLVVRQMEDGSMKYSLSNAPEQTPLKRLARWQAGRFWAERCFQDAKRHCRMGQYQARGWLALNHHMALVALAVLFIMEERMSDELGLGQLTAADIVELMEWAVISKPTESELIARIQRSKSDEKPVP
jgi:SRSO17 transposase